MEEQKKGSFFKRFLKRYIIVVYNQGNFKERISISLTPINVLLILSSLVIVSFALGAFLIAFTPIKEAIPGFGNSYLSANKVYKLQNRVDSFERVVTEYNIYLDSLKKILKGDTGKTSCIQPIRQNGIFHFATFNPEGNYSAKTQSKSSSDKVRSLFPPVNGYISQHFDAGEDHLALDIVTAKNASVKAVDDGMVIFAEWSAQTGNVIIIQHSNNLVSIYKHNSVLFKKIGTFVSRGDVIALVGNSGELSTGPHLHFELWADGSPVDPEDFISF
jgi:murein DD-endopeptidase MepM/ murein hydrolase activator NlpD